MTTHRRVRIGNGEKLQIYLPENTALPFETRSGEPQLAIRAGLATWANLHPNPFIGVTVLTRPRDDRRPAETAGATSVSHVRAQPVVESSAGPLRSSSSSSRAPAAAVGGGAAGEVSSKRDKRDPEQWPFYCDACQKGFATEETYTIHEESHVYCSVPGCHFTCRKDKAYRMDEHMELLHNRPDAPNFADMSVYLDQRRSRFPTHETVQTKVAEIYYKAARGAVLPDERRRWMRQHGIQIGKRPRSGQAFIASGHLDEELQQPEMEAELKREPAPHHVNLDEEDDVPDAQKAEKMETTTATGPSAPPQKVARHGEMTAVASAEASTTAPVKRTHIVPLGPNGTLTAQQRVQLVRQRYAESTEVAPFYVCHRCGKKGEHWLNDCPTRGDPTFDRHTNWGDGKGDGKGEREAPAQPDTPAEANEVAATTEPVAEAEVHHSEDEDEAPPTHSARLSDAAPGQEKERTRLIAPVAAARQAAKNATGTRRAAKANGTGAQAGQRTREPGLYERLTEEDRLNEMGLLLQAFRFFVSRDFFETKS